MSNPIQAIQNYYEGTVEQLKKCSWPSKKELYEAMLRGQCYPSCCVGSMYEAIMKVGPKKWRRFLDDYFEKLPEGTYVILSTDWD